MKRIACTVTLLLCLPLLPIGDAIANERGGLLGRIGGGGGNKDNTMAVSAGRDALRGLTLSDAELTELGAQAAAAFDAQHQVAPPSNPHAQRLQRLTAGYQNEDGLNLNFKVYLDEQINAFALPDGSIRFYSGLMERMNDDELAFVIGHEIGHVKNGHSKGRFRTAYLAQAARKGVASQGNVAGAIAGSELGGLVEEVVKAGYSRGNETEADEYGLAFLRRHGKDPQAAVSALNRLAEIPGNRGNQALSSHPDPDRRATRLNRQIARQR